MTGEDHNSEAFIAALRSPALPAERAGEATVVSAMVEARASVSAAPPGSRSRRGVAIAAVTVASLGLGGLAAAGPGIFSPAADQPDEFPPPAAAPVDGSGEQQTTTELDASAIERNGPQDGDTLNTDDDIGDVGVECADGNHGDTVSSVARAADPEGGKGDEVREAARSDCGKPETTDDEPGDLDDGDDGSASEESGAVECADGNHGDTVSSVARAADPEGGKGDEVREAAHSDCGKKTPSSEGDSPGRSGDAPGQTGNTPGQSGEAPGQSDETPGQSDETPGQSGETPGQSGETPGQSGETPGQSGETPGRGGNKNKDG